MGVTTVWERWDSMLADGSVNPGEMTSLNHYALGSVADWLHRTVGGLAPLEPGYRRFRVAPRSGGGFTHADTSLETPYGLASVSWRLADRLEVAVTVPDGTTAEVDLPDGRARRARTGRAPALIVGLSACPSEPTLCAPRVERCRHRGRRDRPGRSSRDV